jgi:hypothetical protein
MGLLGVGLSRDFQGDIQGIFWGLHGLRDFQTRDFQTRDFQGISPFIFGAYQ